MTAYNARVRPQYSQKAQNLIDIYEKTYGAAGPGCNPASLAAVLRALFYYTDEEYMIELADELDPFHRNHHP